jgi:hypothetical protein
VGHEKNAPSIVHRKEIGTMVTFGIRSGKIFTLSKD